MATPKSGFTNFFCLSFSFSFKRSKYLSIRQIIPSIQCFHIHSHRSFVRFHIQMWKKKNKHRKAEKRMLSVGKHFNTKRKRLKYLLRLLSLFSDVESSTCTRFRSFSIRCQVSSSFFFVQFLKKQII